MGLHQVINQLLIWELGEHCLFPEVRIIAVGLGDGIERSFGEVAQSGSKYL